MASWNSPLFGTLALPLASNIMRDPCGDDRQLIAECLKGGTAAFGELVRRYQDRLYNTVYRLLDNAEDAQDVVQDAFLNAYQSVCRTESREGSAFRGDAQFFTWLYRIAVNQAISLKRKRRLVLSGDARRNGRVIVEPLDESEQTRPARALERAEDERTVQ